MDVMNVSDENTQAERKLSDLEKLGLLQLDLMDIERQKMGIYAQEKAKKAEVNEIYERIREKAREGHTILNKGEG